jgi:hypothetical protein
MAAGMGPASAFLLYIGFMVSFGGLVCAAAVMFPPEDDEPARGGLRGTWRQRIDAGSPMRAFRSGCSLQFLPVQEDRP